MNIKLLDKKRKLIVLLSLTITIILIILFVFGEFLFISFASGIFKISMMGFLVLLFLALLYCLSRFIVIPLYNKIKIVIFKKVFEDKFINSSVTFEKYNKDIEYFYNKNNLTISNSYKICIGDNIFKTYDYKFTSKNGRGKAKEEFKGKYLSTTLNCLKTADIVYVMQNKSKSEDFNNFFFKKFKNVNKEITVGRKYIRYNCYYDEKVDYNIVKILDEIKEFGCLIIKNNILTIYFHENYKEFDFKLKDKIDKNIYFDCKESYLTLINLINKIILMEGNANE